MRKKNTSNSNPVEAKSAIGAVLAACAKKRLQDANEATTRIEVVDRILGFVGWPPDALGREVPSGAGDYLDYELRVVGLPWMVVEAKRTGETFELGSLSKSGDGLLRSLSLLSSRGGARLREVLKQAASYCNDRGVPLGCVTNGHQWVFFRGLSSKGRPWTEGSAFVFENAAAVEAHFDEFWGCLSREWANRPFLLEALDRPPKRAAPSARVPRDSIRHHRAERDAARAALLRNVGTYLFSEIHGSAREDLLERCYVQPGIASEFERSVQRLLKDTERPLEDEPHPVLGGDTRTFIDQLGRQSTFQAVKQPVVVVGHVGVGKTTFLHKCISQFRADREAFCALVDLEGRGQGGAIDGPAEERWVAKETLGKLGRAANTVLKNREDLPTTELPQADPESPESLRTMLRESLETERRLGEKIWNDKPELWAEKEYEIFERFRADPVSHLTRYVRNLSGRFKRADGARYPVLITLDNVDLGTDEYQKCVYGLAHRLARDTQAVVVVCLREDTYVAAREAGGFLTSSALPFVFHVAAPSLGNLLRQRSNFAAYASENGLLPPGLRTEKSMVAQVASLVGTVFLQAKSEALELVAALSGHNMRQALELVRGLVEGHGDVPAKAGPGADYAFECLLIAIGQTELRARYKISNCFDAEPWNPPCHALRARLLAYYSYAFDYQDQRLRMEATESVLARFSTWGYPVALVRSALSGLLADGLTRAVEAGGIEEDEALPRRVTLTSAGYAHVHHLLRLRPYRAAMAIMTRWYDQDAVEQFIASARKAGGDRGPTVADIVESRALDFFDAYLATAVAQENDVLSPAAGRYSWVGEVLSRSGHLLLGPQTLTGPAQAEFVENAAKGKEGTDGKEQGEFPFAKKVRTSAGAVLPRIDRDTSYKESVWIPRLLWALEWARRVGEGPRSASEISAILREHGDIDVPGTNVARALREFREKGGPEGLWSGGGKRYQILPGGTSLLEGMIKEQ